jgi:triacylglycerol lipase
LSLFPAFTFDEGVLETVRAMMAQAPSVDTPQDVRLSMQSATSADGANVRIVLYEPAANTKGATLPAILHIHGGGYVVGSPEMMHLANFKLVQKLGCVVASVDYRLAPEAKYPAAVEDCYAGLRWLHANAASLNVDPARVAIKGESAGGGLAAALALLARDRGDAPIAFQLLVYPMLDDRPTTPANPYTGEFVWTPASNQFGWSALLGGAAGGPDVPAYAAAARATNFEGLPPAFICVGALDLFLEQDIAYAGALLRAGVPTALHVYPGAYHGFDIVSEGRTTKQFWRDSLEALSQALGVTLS